MSEEKVYLYNAEAHLEDGSSVLVDLEERGWANKEFLAHVKRWVLVPKAGAVSTTGAALPFVVINIPEGAKPVFKARNYANMAFDEVGFRIYGIGYYLRKKTYITWVLPTGDIEVGEDSWLADLHFDARLKAAKEHRAAANSAAASN